MADLITAIATPIGTGGVGIVRISGSNIKPILPLLHPPKLPPPRLLTKRSFIAEDGKIMDSGLVAYFPQPHSFTGEEVLELHAHGGLWIMQMLLERCLQLGARLAEAGEFSLRAYLNNKLDLIQAEALVDAINANSTLAAKAAACSLTGTFSNIINQLNARLLHLRAQLESQLDFSDEDDYSQQKNIEQQHEIESLLSEIELLILQSRQGALLQLTPEVTIVGPPNVGKSSLLNCLANKEVAIVTSVAGTTRDCVQQTVHLQGLAIQLNDTAGLRETSDVVEKIGIEKTHQILQTTPLVLSLFTKDTPPYPLLNHSTKIISVCNKIDLSHEMAGSREGIVYVSAKTGNGIEDLKQSLLTALGHHQTSPPFSARQRHLLILQEVHHHLTQARSHLPEVTAAWLRCAHESLSSMTHHSNDEDLLGEIFSQFCIGK